MRVKNLLGRKTAAILLMGAVGLGLTGCFPDTGAPPTDPMTAGLYNALNRDRASVGLPPLTYSPKLANNAGNWAWTMMAHNSLYHQNLGAVLYSSDYQAYYTLGREHPRRSGQHVLRRRSRAPGEHRPPTGPTSRTARSTSSASATSEAPTAGSGRSRSSAGCRPPAPARPEAAASPRLRPRRVGAARDVGPCGHEVTSRDLFCFDGLGNGQTFRITGCITTALDDLGARCWERPSLKCWKRTRTGLCVGVRGPLAANSSRRCCATCASPPAKPPKTSRRLETWATVSTTISSFDGDESGLSAPGSSPWPADARSTTSDARHARPSVPVDPVVLGRSPLATSAPEPQDATLSTLARFESALDLIAELPTAQREAVVLRAIAGLGRSPRRRDHGQAAGHGPRASPTVVSAPWPAASRRRSAP